MTPITPPKGKYHRCNFCKYFTLDAQRKDVYHELGVCIRFSMFGKTLSYTPFWNRRSDCFEFGIHSPMGFMNEEEIEEYEDNYNISYDMKHIIKPQPDE